MTMAKPIQAVSESSNLSERAHELIRRDIMSATVAPGEKLLIDALSARYEIGVVPIREALNRLSSAGLVERRSHRGFFVSRLSMLEFEELVKTRIWLESRALKESISNADSAWEEQIVLAHHRLARTQRIADDATPPVLNHDWEVLHKEFHMALLANCGSTLLLGFCASMMDQAIRYRNLSANAHRTRREGALVEHKQLVDATLAHDVSLACELLGVHYRRTLEILQDMDLEGAASNRH